MKERILTRLADAPVLATGSRTPIGRYGGGLAGLGGVELGGLAVRSVLAQSHGLMPQRVLMGCVLQAGQGQNPARQAAVGGGARRPHPA